MKSCRFPHALQVTFHFLNATSSVFLINLTIARNLFRLAAGKVQAGVSKKMSRYDMALTKSRLTRHRHIIPEFIKLELNNCGVEDDYKRRPAYQQNDYVGWITQAKRPETQAKRLSQMIDELKTGGIYMKMDHPPSRKVENRGISK